MTPTPCACARAPHHLPPQDQVSELTAQLQREATAADEARRAAEASSAEAAAARSNSANEVAAWQAKVAERKKVGLVYVPKCIGATLVRATHSIWCHRGCCLLQLDMWSRPRALADATSPTKARPRPLTHSVLLRASNAPPHTHNP